MPLDQNLLWLCVQRISVSGMHLLNNQQRYLPEGMHGWGIFPSLPAEGHMNRFRLIQYLQEAYASSMQVLLQL
jgi:hypothetical protein